MKSWLPSYIIFLLIASSFSCNDNCANTSPAPTAPISFVIVDSAGKNLVAGNTPSFTPESIKLYEADKKTNTIYKAEINDALKGFWFQADCYKNETGSSTLYLELSNTDTDTLLVSYTTIHDECFIIHEYTHILHNGKEVFPSGETRALRIIK